ncbi:MAG: hypothetical protein H0V09_04890 [Gemmatimonadetes bacterium]|nr:hypothetical protein [Gemmatimonadota bacterium]
MRRLGIAALFLVSPLLACSEDDRNPVGAGELPPLSDAIQEIVLEPVRAEAFETPTADRGLGSFLIGAHELPDAGGFESRLLVRFALTLADTSRGTVRVDSARVRLTLQALQPDTVHVSVHRVTEPWIEDQVTWGERSFDIPWSVPGGAFDPLPLVEADVFGDTVALAVPDTLVQRWLDEAESNAGVIALVRTAASYVRVDAASTAGLANDLGPELHLFVTTNDSSSVSEVLATSDAYITDYSRGAVPGIAAGNEPNVRSLLKFDVSAVPRDASINLAELRLSARQVVSPVDSVRIEFRRAVTEFLGPSTVFSNTLLGTAVARADSTLVFSAPALASLVRIWQSDSTFNQGIGLASQRELGGEFGQRVGGKLGFAVYGGSDAAPGDRPRLRIIFTPALRQDLGRRLR